MSAERGQGELIQRLAEEAGRRGQSPSRNSRDRQAERRARSQEDRRARRPAHRRRADRRDHRFRGRLPNDEMKGRIIGREGRNIRAFEPATGVDVIIDDTPETVVVSWFDPVRREIARLALEKLVTTAASIPADRGSGRQSRARRSKTASRDRRRRRTRVGVNGLHPEIIKLVGRMRWRTSYGRTSSITRRKWRVSPASWRRSWGWTSRRKRGALLHDIGKVLTTNTKALTCSSASRCDASTASTNRR